MSQGDILDFLRENKGEWFSSKAISFNLKQNTTVCLFKLRRFGLVHWEKDGQGFLYKSK